MEKYQAFEQFINNLEKNQSEVLAKLALAENLVATFQRDLTSAKSTLPMCDNKVAELSKQLEGNSLSVTLSAEYGHWTIMAKEHADRVERLTVALEAAKKELAELQEEHAALDPTSLAIEAAEEMKGEIDQMYKEFCATINEAIAARKTYLEAISKVYQVRNKGRHAVEAGQKAQSYAKKNILGQVINFDTGIKQFVISENDVLKA